MASKKPTPAAKKVLPRAPAKKAAPKELKAAKKVLPAKRAPGRPSLFNPDLGRAFCSLLMQGLTLRQACAVDAMPGSSTVMRWLHDDAGNGVFREQYARAREVQAHLDAEEIREIADAPAKTVVLETVARRVKDGDGRLVKVRVPVLVAIDPAEVALRKVQIDARKWSASKKAPKVYGDHLNVEVTEKLVTFRDLTGRKGVAPGAPAEAKA